MKFSFVLFISFYSSLAFTKSHLIYFDDYAKNREAFVELTKQVDPKKWTLSFESWSVLPDPNLTTDVVQFKNARPQSTLLVISSGIHGIEGFVGSAIQRWMISEKLLTNNETNADIAFLHTLNPWGMQNQRRVDQNNIDLNRNFLLNTAGFQQSNADYMKIDSFLNPRESLSLGPLHRIGFLFQSVKLILYNSMDTLRKSILIGQSEQPSGICYRGQQFSPLKVKIDQFLLNARKNYKKIIWLDLHTGYGQRGQLHFLANDSHSPLGIRLTKQFGNLKIDFGNQKNFYKTDGDLATYVSESGINSEQTTGLVFEYGTLDSQTTLGAIESLRRMVIENQVFYFSGQTDSVTQARDLFRQLFFPQDTAWNDSVVYNTERALLNLNLGLPASR